MCIIIFLGTVNITDEEIYKNFTTAMAANCSQIPSNSSILETASLMKKSVLLSPTFVCTTENVTPGEVEISSKNINEDSVALSNLVEPQDSVFVSSDNIDETKLLCDSNDIRKGCVKVDQYKNGLNGEQTSLPNSNQGHPCLLLDGNENPVLDINMTFVKNQIALESNINNGSNDDHSFQSSNTDNHDSNNILTPRASKLDNIAEETIPLSKLREIKRSLKKPCLNGKRNKPVTVQSITDAKAKIPIENGISELQSIMEPNSTEPLENTKILSSELDEVKSQENMVPSNLESMDSNELIEATAVHGAVSLEDIEEVNTDLPNAVENVNLLANEQNLKNFSMNRNTSKCESVDKGSEDYEEDKNKKVICVCELYNQCKASENDITANVATVNGLGGDEKVLTINVDNSVTSCNGQKDVTEPTAVSGMKNHRFEEDEHKCHNDKTEQVCHIQDATDIKKPTTVELTMKPKLNTKQSSHSKNVLDSDGGLKKIIENKISSKNEENKSLEHHELTSILNATKKLSSNVTDFKVDKVKEIAAYLRKFSHIYTDKKKTKKALINDITKKETVNSNTNTIESKLCIQGVEKPGGNEVDRELTGECKVLKTYARRNSPKTSKLSTHILHKTETFKTVDALDLDLDAVNISRTCEMQEFCLCDDFGRLAYYDCDNLYEHIHFWHHRNATSELDLIFAIYTDKAPVSNSVSGLEKEEKTEDKIEAYNVCWNIFQSEFYENVDNTELIGQNDVINELKDACSDDNPQGPDLNMAQKVDDEIVSKNHDEVHLENNSHSDIILETIEHDMVDAAESKNSDRNTEKPLNTDINDNNSAAAESELIDTGLISSQPKLTVSIQISN